MYNVNVCKSSVHNLCGTIAHFDRMNNAPTAFQAPIHISKPSVLKNSKCSWFPTSARRQTSQAKVQRPYFVPVPRAPPSAVQQKDWSTLTTSEFDHRLTSNSLPICLVGMSNCGKSYWSLQLHHHRGFDLICVDDKIEHAIQPELSALGYSGIDGLAAWMGFPTDEQFAANQRKYLQLEESITASAPAGPGNTVLDTTGSVCYLTDVTLQRLRSDYLVVHLEASDDMLDVLTERYFTAPKPVVWGNSFNRLDGEMSEDALRRCYPTLLRERRKLYKAIAHLTIPASKSLSRQLNIDGFMALLRGHLQATRPAL